MQRMVQTLLGSPSRRGPPTPPTPRRSRCATSPTPPVCARRGAPHARAGGAAMIGSLRGELLDRSASGEVLVEVGGVGYRVHGHARDRR